VEYGTISHKDITQISMEVFGATRPKRHGESRKLIFHPLKLEKLAMVYNLDVKIEVTVGETHGARGTLVGLDRHLQEQPSNENTKQTMEENSDRGTSTIENIEKYTLEELEGDPGLSTEVTHAPQVSRSSNDQHSFNGKD
jgi:hypothetical protein